MSDVLKDSYWTPEIIKSIEEEAEKKYSELSEADKKYLATHSITESSEYLKKLKK